VFQHLLLGSSSSKMKYASSEENVKYRAKKSVEFRFLIHILASQSGEVRQHFSGAVTGTTLYQGQTFFPPAHTGEPEDVTTYSGFFLECRNRTFSSVSTCIFRATPIS
jgi:hypothetical protein